MLRFENSLSIHICARSESDRERWAAVFGRLFQNFTRVDGQGGWVGDKYIETEPVIIVTCWLPEEWSGWKRFVRYAQTYQAVADQEAVGLQFASAGKLTGLVVFENDWREVECLLEQTFDRGSYLANYFCSLRDSGEHPTLGCDYPDHEY